MSTKVNPSGTTSAATTAPAAPKAKREKRERKKRAVFPKDKAVGRDGKAIALDDKGRLLGAPANYESRYGRLKKADFGTKEAFFDFLILGEENQIKKVQERIKELQDLRAGKVDETAKKSKKLKRMQDQMAKLREELAAAGVDISKLG